MTDITPIEIQAKPTYGDGHFGSDHVVVTPSRYGRRGGMRFGVGYVSAEGSCRRVQDGPVLPGPYAYLFPLASVIAADPEHGTYGERRRNLEAGREHTVPTGGLVEIDGLLFRVEDPPVWGQYPKLELVEEPEASAIRDAQAAEEALEEYRISLAVERVQEAQRAADALLSYRGRDRAAKLRDARAARAAAEADLDYLLERRGVSREA